MARRPYGTGSIEERGKDRFRITVYRGRDPLTGKIERHRFTFSGTRKGAERALREAQTKLDHGVEIAPDKITIAEWLTRWLERHAGEGYITPKTHDRYKRIVEAHLVPALGRLRLHELRPDHVNEAKSAWLTGKGSTAPRALSPASVHKHLVILRKALKDALRSGLIVRNPLEAVTAPSPRARSERRALTDDEIGQLLTAASGTRYDAPIRFTLATGLRQGELLGLKWEDVDIDAGTLAVRRSVSYVTGKATFVAPKTRNSRRTIELSAATVSLLKTHRATQVARRLHLGAAWQDNDLIFPSLKGTIWLPRAFYRDYRAVVSKTTLRAPEEVNWHALRHTAASQWLRRGADVFSVSRRLGHASASFTMDVYGHLLKGQQRVAAEALDSIIAGA